MQTIFAVLGSIVVLLLIAAVVVMVRSRFSASDGADDRENDRQLRDRLEHPRFDEIEERFRSTVSDELRWLYGQPDIVRKRNVHIESELEAGHEYEIDHFLPADSRTVEEVWFPIGEKRFPFAIDGFGNYFFTELGNDLSKPATVFYIDHDGGAIWPIAHSLKAWLSTTQTS